MTTATKYSDRGYRANAAALRKATSDNGWPCHLCGKPIDMTLPYTHPLAFTADHLTAIANGGNLLGELAPAGANDSHTKCGRQRPRKTGEWFKQIDFFHDQNMERFRVMMSTEWKTTPGGLPLPGMKFPPSVIVTSPRGL